MQHAIQSAAFSATERIVALLAPFIPEPEWEMIWGCIFAEVQAGILAALGMDRPEERLSPGQELTMKLLSVKEAADQAGVSESLVYQWVDERLLTHYRLGGKGKRGSIRIEEADLSAFLASCRHEAKPQVPPLKHIRLNHG